MGRKRQTIWSEAAPGLAGLTRFVSRASLLPACATNSRLSAVGASSATLVAGDQLHRLAGADPSRTPNRRPDRPATQSLASISLSMSQRNSLKFSVHRGGCMPDAVVTTMHRSINPLWRIVQRGLRVKELDPVLPTAIEGIETLTHDPHVRSSYVQHLLEIAALSSTGADWSGSIAGIERRRWM